MSKRSKSKRFVKQGTDSVTLHDQQFPYHLTLAQAEAEKERNNSTLGGV